MIELTYYLSQTQMKTNAHSTVSWIDFVPIDDNGRDLLRALVLFFFFFLLFECDGREEEARIARGVSVSFFFFAVNSVNLQSAT